MNNRLLIILTMMMVLLTSCYSPITGTVVDADTNAPIEGAVVLVEWTKTHGIGEHWTESYKVVETVTDKDGKFTLPGCYSPFVDMPDVAVYEKGYVAWSSRIIFPDSRKRDDFLWRDGYVFKLERFNETFSYDNHYYFITSAARLESATDKKHLFIKAYDEWEREKAIKERNEKKRGGVNQ